ncbi:unnamed protein product [Pleuronectes platessa]|uniref:Uncharacterized protein n=1 Tax=Pleuronectes platessa TaxID=8262 RepID=A0A9N7UMJ0_PLEPL|nr:unnamed protein product [Pleuronectes platessa]
MIKRIQRNKGPLAATLAQHKTNISILNALELAKLEKLEQLLEPCFKDLKCLPKEERGEVGALLRNLMLEDKGGMHSTPVRREKEDPKKQTMSSFLLASSDTDSEEEEEESIEHTHEKLQE